ncbi:MAG: response regulator [Eubacterium sp.]|nr:response regulator [Eubacterium sp.]MCM1214195.1 response regulator [Lachnospiraceae bacterium]MCM1302646.1 response regulator [Butyrivibrio sp.]MCM1342225.1 response regulator [Muribaculaceae bacterium]MCM1238145.1 response regulator [Lachnospiraceae bacterium]
MTNIIVALPKLEDARGIKNILVRNGFQVTGVCTTGAQAISQADGLNDGIIICSFKLADMVYSELQECMPCGFEMLLMASGHLLSERMRNGIVCLSMPLKVNDLISTVGMMCEGILRKRRKSRSAPRVRSAEEEADIRAAKELLMARNHMTEEEAHRYLQKCSMDSGTNIVETARMALSMMGE